MWQDDTMWTGIFQLLNLNKIYRSSYRAGSSNDPLPSTPDPRILNLAAAEVSIDSELREAMDESETPSEKKNIAPLAPLSMTFGDEEAKPPEKDTEEGEYLGSFEVDEIQKKIVPLMADNIRNVSIKDYQGLITNLADFKDRITRNDKPEDFSDGDYYVLSENLIGQNVKSSKTQKRYREYILLYKSKIKDKDCQGFRWEGNKKVLQPVTATRCWYLVGLVNHVIRLIGEKHSGNINADYFQSFRYNNISIIPEMLNRGDEIYTIDTGKVLGYIDTMQMFKNVYDTVTSDERSYYLVDKKLISNYKDISTSYNRFALHTNPHQDERIQLGLTSHVKQGGETKNYWYLLGIKPDTQTKEIKPETQAEEKKHPKKRRKKTP